MRIKIDLNFKDIDFKVNRIIRFFIIADLMFWGGWGFIGPIFALFVVQRIPGASTITVGTAIGMYWLVKSLLQLPIAVFLDKQSGEKDDFYALLLGLIIAGFAAMMFTLVNTVPGLFAAILLQAIGFSLYLPSWSGMFSRHLDPEHYSFDWSLDSTTLGLASALTAFLGGALAKWLGFNAVFVVVSVLSFATAALLFFLPNFILPKTKSDTVMVKDHRTP